MQSTAPKPDPSAANDEFQRLAEKPQAGIVRELVDFLLANKAWWLAPIVMVLLLVSLLIILSASGAAPLIYTLF
jgi:uncharacterized protein DUF5989